MHHNAPTWTSGRSARWRAVLFALTSLTACAARAEVVYTDVPDVRASTRPTITFGAHSPFQLTRGAQGYYSETRMSGIADDGMVGANGGNTALLGGRWIDDSYTWAASAALLSSQPNCTPNPITGMSCGYGLKGPWADGGEYYLALRFRDADGTHYGWARLETTVGADLLLKDYAYETLPDRPIATGAIGTGPLTIIPATGITDVEAVISGTAQPGGRETAVSFQWGLDTSYGNAGAPRVVSGDGETLLEETLSGLAPDTTYHFRLVAEAAGETTFSRDMVFKTMGPHVLPASGIRAQSSIFHGTIPPSSPAVLSFEYRKALMDGTREPYMEIPAQRGANGVVWAMVHQLEPSTSYEYRLVAAYPAGAVHTPSVYFKTTKAVAGTYTTADAALALYLAGGLLRTEDSRLDVVTEGASSGAVDIADAVRLARKAAGVDPNP